MENNIEVKENKKPTNKGILVLKIVLCDIIQMVFKEGGKFYA